MTSLLSASLCATLIVAIASSVLLLSMAPMAVRAEQTEQTTKLKSVLDATDKILGAIVDRWEVRPLVHPTSHISTIIYNISPI